MHPLGTKVYHEGTNMHPLGTKVYLLKRYRLSDSFRTFFSESVCAQGLQYKYLQ